MKNQQPIDFVVAYVNGGDTEWIKKKNSYLSPDQQVDAREIRYRDWDNLKYWFRAVEKYAPWVHKVYLVTDHQAPEWINKDCEKLVLINHDDYIPSQYLPVFSANPIELNFHRIEGLSEQFVYFNDDVFLTDFVTPEDFFKDGLPCDYAVEAPLCVNDRTFFHILSNDLIFLNNHADRREYLGQHYRRRFSFVWKRGALRNLYFSLKRSRRFIGFEYMHLAAPFLKSTLETVWAEDKLGWLEETTSHRFRSSFDVNQYVFKQYQYIHGLYTPYNRKKYSKEYQLNDSQTSKNNINRAVMAIRNRRYQQICINDAYISDFESSKELINAAFEAVLPDKCGYEK